MSTTAPSTSTRPASRTGGNSPGSAAVAIRAGRNGPHASTTSSPVSRSAAITRNGIARSSKRGGVPPRSTTARRPSSEKRWSSLVSRFHARARRPPGKMTSPRSCSHSLGEPVDRREGRVGGEHRAVPRAGRRADDDVGHDVAFEQRAQHADLAHGLVATAGQHERGARWLGREPLARLLGGLSQLTDRRDAPSCFSECSRRPHGLSGPERPGLCCARFPTLTTETSFQRGGEAHAC